MTSPVCVHVYRRSDPLAKWTETGSGEFSLSQDCTLIVATSTEPLIELSLRNSDFLFEVEGNSLQVSIVDSAEAFLLVFDEIDTLTRVTSCLEPEGAPGAKLGISVVQSFLQLVAECKDPAVLGSVARNLLCSPDTAVIFSLAEESVFTTVLACIDGDGEGEHVQFFGEKRRKLDFKSEQVASLADKFYRLLYLRDSVIPRVLDDPIIAIYSAAMGEIWRSLIALGVEGDILKEKENEEQLGSPVLKKRRLEEACCPTLIDILFNQLLVVKGVDFTFRKAVVVAQIVQEIKEGDGRARARGLEVLSSLNAPVISQGVWSDLFALILEKPEEKSLSLVCQLIKGNLEGEMTLQAFYKRSRVLLTPVVHMVKSWEEIQAVQVAEFLDLLASFASTHGHHARTWLIESDASIVEALKYSLSEGKSDIVRSAVVRFLRAVVNLNHPTVSRKIAIPLVQRIVELASQEVPSLLSCSIQGLFSDAAREKQNVLIQAILSATPPEMDWPVLERLKRQRDAIKAGGFVLQVRESVFLERQDSMLFEDPAAAGFWPVAEQS